MRRRYYAVDFGCAEHKGKPQYKKVRADGSFRTPFVAWIGSHRLYWDGSYWVFYGFGPRNSDILYTNGADTPQPPHDGWKQNDSSGRAPYPTVTML